MCWLKMLGVMMSLFNGIIRGLKMLGAMMSLFDGIIYPWVEHVVLKVLEVLDTSVWKKNTCRILSRLNFNFKDTPC